MLRNKKTLAILTVLVLIMLTLAGCGTKATGGGWIESASGVEGEKATFGFNAQILPEDEWTDEVNAKGQFQYIDHGTDYKIHGTVLSVATEEGFDDQVSFAGVTKAGEDFLVIVYDSNQDDAPSDGDMIEVYVGDLIDYEYHNTGTLHGGNINVK